MAQELNILIISSSAQITECLSFYSDELNAQKHVTHNRESAIEYISNHKEQPTLIVIDNSISNESAFELLTELQNLSTELGVVVIVSTDELHELSRYLEAGTRDYLIKGEHLQASTKAVLKNALNTLMCNLEKKKFIKAMLKLNKALIVLNKENERLIEELKVAKGI